jgi:hypothetical protein
MAFPNQISNRNFLSPVGFKFTISKNRKIDFFSNKAKVPGLTLGIANQPTPFKMIDVPGDIIQFEDFTLTFLVDENLENYMAIHNWITGLGFPENYDQYKNFTTDSDGIRDEKLQYSDGSLVILNSNYREIAQIRFKDLYPYSLTPIDFDATANDIQYFTAEATFKYTVYNIVDANGDPL